jgi:hypothetical protein
MADERNEMPQDPKREAKRGQARRTVLNAKEGANVLRRLFARAPSQQPRNRRAVPEQVQRRLTQVGNRYFFGDGEEAFFDRGRRLTTHSENTALVRMLVDVAKARHWQRLEVCGSRRFRQRVWQVASAVNVAVEGYRPTRFERAKLAQGSSASGARSSGSVAPTASAGPPEKKTSPPAASGARGGASTRAKSASAELIVGRLVEHGPARYQFREDQPLSYFMKLQTERGSRVLWGKDLPRALTSSQTKVAVNDMVGARRVGRESVTVLNQQRDIEGRVVSRTEQQAHRNQWVVEKTRYFTERARAARQLRDGQLDARETLRVAPELKDSFTTLHAAAELAAAKIQHPEDREKFMELLRERLAQSMPSDSGRSQQQRTASTRAFHETDSLQSKPGRTR